MRKSYIYMHAVQQAARQTLGRRNAVCCRAATAKGRVSAQRKDADSYKDLQVCLAISYDFFIVTRTPSNRIPFAVRSDSVRRPIRFRPPSDQIPSAVRSDSVRV